MLKETYPKLGGIKCANIERIETLRKKCFERVNSGKVKLDMGDLSKRYAYIGAIRSVNENGLVAKMAKRWDELTRGEVTDFFRKTSNRKDPDDVIAIAAFFMEGTPDRLRLDAARKRLDKAAAMGADVAALLEYVETLKPLAEQNR